MHWGYIQGASGLFLLCGDKGKQPSAEPTLQPLVNAQQVSGFLNSQPELMETHFGLDAGPDSLTVVYDEHWPYQVGQLPF